MLSIVTLLYNHMTIEVFCFAEVNMNLTLSPKITRTRSSECFMSPHQILPSGAIIIL